MILKEIAHKIAQTFRLAQAADKKLSTGIATALDAKAEQLREYEKRFEPEPPEPDPLLEAHTSLVQAGFSPKGHPEWSLVKCPICGQECWRPMSRQELRQKKMQADCTECGLKIESRRNQP